MARIVLVTGGSRSGKSGHAQRLAESLPGPRVYLATCPALDEETKVRIQRHREDREGRGWAAIEEGVHLSELLREASEFRVVLVDCLTLWINNLLYEAEGSGRLLHEEDVAAECEELIETCRLREGVVLMVTNEVGWGIVPENPLSRRFRDLAGRCNQVVARAADQVVLLVSGIPIILKGNDDGKSSG